MSRLDDIELMTPEQRELLLDAQRRNYRLQAFEDRLSPDTRGLTRKAFSAGVDNTQAMLHGGVSAVADVVGADMMAESAMNRYKDNVFEAQKTSEGIVTTLEQAESPGDYAEWAWYNIVSQVPSMATMVAGGGITGAGLGAAAKLGAKKALQKQIGSTAAKNVARGMTQKEALKAATQQVTASSVKKGQIAGFTLPTVGMNTGEIMGSIESETGEMRGGVALVSGAVAGLLDTAPLFRIARVAGMSTGQVKQGILQNIQKTGIEALKQGGYEGVTESAQTLIELGAIAFVEQNLDAFTEDGLSNLMEAAAAGTLIGVVTGGIAGGYNSMRSSPEVAEKAKEIADPEKPLPKTLLPDDKKAAQAAIKDWQEQIRTEAQYNISQGDQGAVVSARQQIAALEERVEQINALPEPGEAANDTDSSNKQPSKAEDATSTLEENSDSTASEPESIESVLLAKNGKPWKTEKAATRALTRHKHKDQYQVVQKEDGYALELIAKDAKKSTNLDEPVESGQTKGTPLVEDTTEAARIPEDEAKPDVEATEATIAQEIDQAANEAATSPQNDLPEPTEAQKEVGNYKKGHIKWHGHDISIENPKDSTRSGTDPDGEKWENTMGAHYGDLKGVKGADGDDMDIFMGPNPLSEQIFVIDQAQPDGTGFDEHKVMAGFETEQEARDAYMASYDDGWKGLGQLTPVTVEDFIKWTKESDTTKQFGEKSAATESEPVSSSGEQEPRQAATEEAYTPKTNESLDPDLAAQESEVTDVEPSTVEDAKTQPADGDSQAAQVESEESQISPDVDSAINEGEISPERATLDNDTPEKRVNDLNQALAKAFGDSNWENAYEAATLPDDSVERGKAIEVALGIKVQGIRANNPVAREEFNGIHIPRHLNTVFYDVEANRDFIAVVGHEYLHVLAETRPDLYRWFARQSIKHTPRLSDYIHDLNEWIGEGGEKHDRISGREELLADFSGDALSDPEFLKKLASDDTSKFRQLLEAVVDYLKKVVGKLRDHGSDQYLTDVEGLQDKYLQVLKAYRDESNIADAIDTVKFSRRRSEPGDELNSFTVPDDTLTKVVIRKLQDKFKVLKDLQVNIKASGGEISEAADAYRAEELFHERAGGDLRGMRDDYVEPLAKMLNSYDIAPADLDTYLYARHAAERNAHIASINLNDPDMQDGGSGMTNQEASQVLSDVSNSGKQAEYDMLANHVYDMLQEQRDIIRETGLEDDTMIDAWEEKYENYVPLKGWSADERRDSRPKTGKGFTIGGRESRRSLGRKSKAASPTIYAISDLTQVHIRNRKNEVGNAFLKMVEDNPEPNYWQVFTDENPETDRRVVKTAEGEEVREMTVPMAMMSDRYFTTKRDGKLHYIKLEDERLMRAMKNIGPETNNGLIRFMSAYVRFLSSMNTSFYPEFVVSNFARDIQTGALNLLAEQSRDDGKAQNQKLVKNTIRDVRKAMPAIYKVLRGKDGGEWGQWFEEFRKEGATTGWFDMKDIDGQAKNLEQLINIERGGVTGNAVKYLKKTGEFVEHLNSSVENAVRLSAYKNARDAGISKSQAASLAKNLTVNFNRKGEIGTLLNALYMFANASIQGTANFARTMIGLNGDKKLRWRNLNNAQKVAVGIMAGSFFLSMLNRWGAGEDDDGVNWYDKIPDYVKERNLVIMKSLFGGDDDGSYIKIPLPYGFNVFAVFGTSMDATINGNKSIGKSASNMALATLGSFSPIGFSDSDSIGGLLLKNATPTIAQPIVDVRQNENFFGGSIYNENFPFGTPKPESSLGRRNTNDIAKSLARWLNATTGGSDHRSGAIDMNPDVMMYFLEELGGSTYKFWLDKTPDTIKKAVQGVEVEMQRVPFISRVYGRVMPYEDRDKFYRRRDEVGQLNAELKTLTGKERKSFVREFGPRIRMKDDMKQAEKALKRLRGERDKVYADTGLSARKADQKLKAVYKEMKAVVDRFNREWLVAVEKD